MARNLNGTQAAIRAGYSLQAANEIAAEDLAKASVKEARDRRSAAATATYCLVPPFYCELRLRITLRRFRPAPV